LPPNWRPIRVSAKSPMTSTPTGIRSRQAAKKLNSKIGDNLYKLFVNATAYTQRDGVDHYSPRMDGVPADGVPADNDVSKDEIAETGRADSGVAE
jgi:hypothetical protein